MEIKLEKWLWQVNSMDQRFLGGYEARLRLKAQRPRGLPHAIEVSVLQLKYDSIR